MKWGRATLVIVGALIITALGIDAADTINGNTGTLLSQVISRGETSGGCPQGMVAIATIPSLSCADMYEVSPSSKCPALLPEQTLHTQQNIASPQCAAESKAETLPWRFITRDQAMQMCARAGKRLPTSEELYALSLGMSNVESSCNVSSKQVTKTGEYQACASPQRVYDLVGNVWEWASDDVIDGVYKMRTLPESGYVSQVDASGMAVAISGDAQDIFDRDYFWSRSSGAYGVIRGGYYDSGTDAGIYSVHADTPPTSASIGIGFRCVQ
jgi:formylglycine-generating enzyme required for sulfatase activity